MLPTTTREPTSTTRDLSSAASDVDKRHHEKTYFVVGINKLVPDIAAGIDRIHNIAAPRNAHRKGKKTPCAAGDRCYDCAALERICNALTIHYKKMSYRPMELVLIEEELGL